MRLPSGLKRTRMIDMPLTLVAAVSTPVATSHTVTVSAEPPPSKWDPSGLNSKGIASPGEPLIDRVAMPVTASHNLIVPSFAGIAYHFPSGLIAVGEMYPASGTNSASYGNAWISLRDATSQILTFLPLSATRRRLPSGVKLTHNTL